MGIGLGIVLIVIGTVLVWAVDLSSSGLSLAATGWALILAGFAGLVLTVGLWGRQTWLRRQKPIIDEIPVYDEGYPPPTL
jgi:hypothetical protein